MKEIITAAKAAYWYISNPENQYDDTHVHQYDFAAQTLTNRQDFAARLMTYIGQHPQRLLEIGAGTGLVSQAIHRSHPDAIYSDREPAALAVLKKRLGHAAVVEADFYSLPFANQSFDTVVSVGAYRYVAPERKQEFWDEMQRVITPDGRVIVAQFRPRISHLRGIDIRNESTPNFVMTPIDTYTSSVQLGVLAIKSGLYDIYECRPTSA